MAAAVVVTSAAGAPTPECPIWLQANEAIVTATQQFIDWQPAPADLAGATLVATAIVACRHLATVAAAIAAITATVAAAIAAITATVAAAIAAITATT